MTGSRDKQDDNVYYCIHSLPYNLDTDPQQLVRPGLQLANALMQNVIFNNPFFDAGGETTKPILLFKDIKDVDKYLAKQPYARGDCWGRFAVRCDPSKIVEVADKNNPSSVLIAGMGNPIPDAVARRYSDVTILHALLGARGETGYKFDDIWDGIITKAGIEAELAKRINDAELKNSFQNCLNAVAALQSEDVIKDPLKRNACDAVQTQAYLLMYDILKNRKLGLDVIPSKDHEEANKQISHINTSVNLCRQVLKPNATKDDIEALATFAKNEAPGKSKRWKVWTGVLVFVSAVALIALGAATLGIGAGAIALGAILAIVSGTFTHHVTKKTGLSKALDQFSLMAKGKTQEKAEHPQSIGNVERKEDTEMKESTGDKRNFNPTR
jgi:hypothetical protein